MSTKKYSGIVNYIARRVIGGYVDYKELVTRRPDLKEEVDRFLTEHGRQDLIVPVE